MSVHAFRSESWPADPLAVVPATTPAIRLAADADTDAADGWLARQVARAAGSFEHGLLGRAPTSVTVVGSDAWMVVFLHEQFSPLERQLAATDASGARRVSEFHHGLFDRTAEALREHVRLATGVMLSAAIAHVDTATGSVLKTLATSVEVDLFLLGVGLPVLGVPVNDHRRATNQAINPARTPARTPARNQEPGPSRVAGIGADRR